MSPFFLFSYIFTMDKITGKTLVFTDFHIGLAGNRESRLKICINVVKKIIERIKADNISTIVFGGDWHHSRTTLDSNALNISYKLVSALAKYARCILICGNHDIYLKNSTDINSINIFKDIHNVEIVAKPDEVEMNGLNCLLVPWLSDLSAYEKEAYDFIFGHFDISSKYLISSYIEDHSRKLAASKSLASMIENDDILAASDKTSKANDEIGDFVEYAKRSGTVFAGHIHKHKEFISKGRNFIFVGSPYQQTLGDVDNECGYYVIDEKGNYAFTEITGIPRHVKLLMSDVIDKSVDGYDFSCVTGNIIQKVYDIDISAADEAKITQRITDMKPYEELLPDYQVKLAFGENSTAEEKTSIELLKKSKLDYVRNYVDNIDQKALDSDSLDREKLFSILEAYYNKAIA